MTVKDDAPTLAKRPPIDDLKRRDLERAYCAFWQIHFVSRLTPSAAPIAADLAGVLTAMRSDVLTLGLVFAIYFASSGVESLRIGLNRAYGEPEPRAWWLLRMESILYVIVGAVAILAFSFLVVLAPFIWVKLLLYVPAFGRYLASFAFAYVTMYAGLASAMIALIFLYVCASIFIYGGELNSVIAKERVKRDREHGRR